MNEIEYRVLSFVHKKFSPTWVDLLREFPPAQIIDIHQAAKKLLDIDGFLEVTSPMERPPRCRIRLTEIGFDALCEKEEQQCVEDQIREYNQRRDEERRQLEAAVMAKAEEQIALFKQMAQQQIDSLKEIAAAARSQAEQSAKQAEAAIRQAEQSARHAEAAEQEAEAAIKQAQLAEESAKAADAESQKALKLSRRSNTIALLSVLVSLLTGFFTREDVVIFISSALQWLKTIW